MLLLLFISTLLTSPTIPSLLSQHPNLYSFYLNAYRGSLKPQTFGFPLDSCPDFLILLYKSLFFTYFPACMKDMFSLRSSYNLRGNNILSLRKPRTTSYGLNSFSYFSSKLWNTLPDSIRMSEFMDFRREIQGRLIV